jgi:hypothetical protein
VSLSYVYVFLISTRTLLLCLARHSPCAVDTVVQDNINPIEKAERSLLIMATTLHRAPAAALVQPEHVPRLAGLTPGLFSLQTPALQA